MHYCNCQVQPAQSQIKQSDLQVRKARGGLKGKEWLAQKVDLLHHGQKGEHLVGEKIAMKGGKGGPGKRQKTIVPGL